MSATHPDYDRLWKDVITELFEEFLLFFVPDLYEQVDFNKKPQFLEQELQALFPESELGKRYTDKLAKLHLKNGTEQWVLVHIEVQGSYDKQFAERMFRYFYRVLDKYDRKIYAIALFTDDTWRPPHEYEYEFFGTKLTYSYNIYEIAKQEEESLLESANPFALAILAGYYVMKGKQEKREKYNFKMRLIRLLLQRFSLDDESNRKYIHHLFSFIDHIIELPKAHHKQFAQDVGTLIEKEEPKMALSLENTSLGEYYKQKWKKEAMEEGKAEGKAEGMEEGKAKGKVEIAKNMIKEGFDIEMIVKLTGLSTEEVTKLMK